MRISVLRGSTTWKNKLKTSKATKPSPKLILLTNGWRGWELQDGSAGRGHLHIPLTAGRRGPGQPPSYFQFIFPCLPGSRGAGVMMALHHGVLCAVCCVPAPSCPPSCVPASLLPGMERPAAIAHPALPLTNCP